MDSAAFVFLDETSTATNMVRRYGWGPKGKRLVDAAPHGHWCSTTLIAGLRASDIVAPLVLDGPLTGKIWGTYVEQFLAPALAFGDVVVMDTGQQRCPGRSIRSPACARRSGLLAPAPSTCRLTRPISTHQAQSA